MILINGKEIDFLHYSLEVLNDFVAGFRLMLPPATEKGAGWRLAM